MLTFVIDYASVYTIPVFFFVLYLLRDFLLGLLCIANVTFFQNSLIYFCYTSRYKTGLQQCSKILSAKSKFMAPGGWQDASTMHEGQELWSDLHISLSSGALCSVGVNYYTFLYVMENRQQWLCWKFSRNGCFCVPGIKHTKANLHLSAINARSSGRLG